MFETNPIELVNNLRETLKIYIPTTLPISRRYPELQKAFVALVERKNLVEGPYVEGLPDFEKGGSLRMLLKSEGGYLHDGFANLPTDVLDRPLHLHQERALAEACKNEKSLIVATGTGSGKTETFLFPIAQRLLTDPAPNMPGVRALLVYPMNALANDQLFYRIAPLFGCCLNTHKITFGRYTSQIHAHAARRDEEYKLKNNTKLMSILNHSIPDNWLLTREEMLENPPKILITNYAMLEHLLLLPRNAPLFLHNALQCIVLDEIHTYSGAQATEVAYLLRKLKNRLKIDYPIQVFGTSASLATGTGADKMLLSFVSDLFGEMVHTVIRGKRIPHRRLSEELSTSFSLNEDDWIRVGALLQRLISENPRDLQPNHWNMNITNSEGGKIPSLKSDKPFPQALEEVFRENAEIRAVAAMLHEKAIIRFDDLAQRVFLTGDNDQKKYEALSALMHLGMISRHEPESFPLLPSRYHIAVNGIEGVSVKLSPNRKEGWSDIMPFRHFRDDKGAPYYPLLVCRRCGQPYVEGYASSSGSSLFNTYADAGLDEHQGQRQVFWLGTPPVSQTLDEDDEQEDERKAVKDKKKMKDQDETKSVYLDVETGKLLKAGDNVHTVQLHRVSTTQDEVERRLYVRSCPACGGRVSGAQAEIATSMHPGDDALGAVVTQKVLEAVPIGSDSNGAFLPMQGRSLLTFSDNRQNAAYFAPYFESTSGGIALRTAIYQAIINNGEPLNFEDTTDLVLKYWRRFGNPIVLDANGEIIQNRQRMFDYLIGFVIAEFCTPGGRRNSLESLGLVKITYDGPKVAQLIDRTKEFLPAAFKETASSLINILIENIRREKAIYTPYGLDMKDPYIWGDIYANHRSFEIKKLNPQVTNSWIPPEGSTRHNRRTWYLVERLGWPWEDARNFLASFWQALLDLKMLVHLSPGYGFDVRLINLLSGRRQPLYFCSDCSSLGFDHINSCCPAFRCKGEVRKMTEEERTNHEKHNHYIRSFREEKAQTVRAREHTAALSTELRQQIEQEFSEKKINVISCTTTMELGVDLGELEAVVCLNIPPGISNYQQRTGRAGRRAQAAPFCVTIARNSQYDQAVYREFENYLRHPAAVPRVHLANAQLFQRHQNSVIISAFLRNCIKDLTINAPSLTDLFGQDFDENAYQLFRECIYSWLDSQNGKEAIDEAGHLGNTLPADLASGVSLSGMALKMLFAKEMTMFAQEVKERWLLYSKKWNEFYEARNIRMVSHWENLRKKYMRQFLIDQLSTRGLIPTYSFPVHTLTLEVTKETGQRGNFYDDREISLSRDAVLGISEYAPGSEVVANGRIWTSEGLAYYPRMFMPTRYYCLCPECRHVDIGEDTNDLPANCSFCGSNKGRFHRSFIEPKGFVTAYENRKGKDPSRNRVRKQYAEEARLISSARSDQYVATDIPSIQKVLLRGHSRAEEVPVGTLFIVNRGPFGVGYHRCNICNYMIPAHKMAKVKQRHTELLSEKNCWNEELTWPIDLSHIFNTDVCIFRFLGRIPLQERSENNRQRLQNYYDSFSRTFSEALRFAAVDLLNIEPGELLATYKMHDGYLEAILYDAVSGGAGYAVRIFQEIKLKTLLNRSVKLLDCPDHCSRACRSCLCDYSNQRLWDTFDRKPVLEWSRKLSVEMSEHPYLRMGGILWERPSLEILSEKLAAYRKIHLTSRRLFAQRSGDSDTLPLKWLLDMMNRGCIFHIYLSEPLEFSKSSLDIGQKKVMSYLRPYIEHKQLIINQLPDEDGGMFIPRVFTKPESGQSAWFSGYPVPAILNEILPSPVYQVNLNHEQAGDLKEFIEGAKAYPTDIISESPLLKHWEIKAGEQRNLKDYFSSIKNAYIDELIIKDPYCGSGERQKDALGKFMKEICLLATTVKKVTVQCREQSYKNPTYEYPTKMRESIMKLLEPITTGKKAEIEIRVLDFSTSRAFHDRSVQINIIDPEGEKKVHLYDLSGGIDFLMDEKVDTKIYYFKDI